MKKNVGGIDRMLRFFVSALLFIGVVMAPVSGEVSVVMFIFACMTLLTATFSYCPLWPVLGINSCKPKQDEE